MNLSDIIIFGDKKIGLSLSGGADSSLLAYFLMKNTKAPIHFFTYANKEKHYRTIKTSVSVIERCVILTNNTNVFHHIRYAETQQRTDFLNFLTKSVDNNIVDVMYTATTAIPPLDVLSAFSKQLPEDIKKRRNPCQKKPLWSHGRTIYHPFINIDKKEIFKFYNELSLIDSLYPLTSSCESLDNVSEHCGQCWWCQERIWAFKKVI